jgi:hypothetical protein
VDGGCEANNQKHYRLDLLRCLDYRRLINQIHSAAKTPHPTRSLFEDRGSRSVPRQQKPSADRSSSGPQFGVDAVT